MGSMVNLLGMYHNYQNLVELILELYCETAKRMLCYLTTTASRILYEQTINLIQMYAHHNQGKRCIEKEAEEDQFKDILLLMELLTSILSKDFIDLGMCLLLGRFIRNTMRIICLMSFFKNMTEEFPMAISFSMNLLFLKNGIILKVK